ncbi:hypothetical protein S1OALGB6SA_694 [Olavius algarvensis spirochete endosymbiont]|uniref:EscU/YscU/HrcU family type III secretion system export apparatus switch protein n=1 Tax=Olavius algarvensis spirochete endosymbiont TaxID=260710 RepID=UPI0003647039|nr:EscU/YscU/HrcU family type III secretion system export apparatus switch protein [Olavius algarvensis spirochete endosymbiont]VDA99623.1 hypothetical protein S1OALGB6SA_694 [Olavius algarvensis spirochete endosymbiont]
MEEKKAAALGYEPGDYAPKIFAKGTDVVADAICKIAQENRIPIVKSPHLAYSLSEINPFDYIPEKYWTAVAEILRFVYETRRNDE